MAQIRERWKHMFAFLQIVSPPNAPYNGKLSKLGGMFDIGNNIAPTLYQMGVIQKTPDGWIIPAEINPTAAMWKRVRELYPLTKEERERRIAATPSPYSVAEKKAAFELELDRIAASAEISHGEIIAFAERLAGAGYNVEIAHPNGSFYIKIQR